jgi:hypothetical protein
MDEIQDDNPYPGKIKNAIRDVRRNVSYHIYADRKLSRREMLDEVRKFNFTTLNIRQKHGNIVTILCEE